MASVSITGQFLDAVRKNIDHLSSEARTRSVAPVGPRPKLNGGAATLLRELAWGEHLPLRAVIPKEWRTTLKQFVVAIPRDEEFTHRETVTDVVLGFPPGTRSHPTITIPLAYLSDEAMLEKHPELVWFKDVCRRAWETRESNLKWAKIRSDVLAFFRTYNSLGRALKAQPAMRIYVPKEYLDRLETQVKREKSEVKPPAVDYGALTAAAVEVHLAKSVDNG